MEGRRRPSSALRSRLVAWAKVLLPLAALALLSTIFLLARQTDPDAALPYAEVDAKALARDPRVTAPELSAVTSDGTAINLTAETATPQAGTDAQARNIRMTLRPDGAAASDLTAGAAQISGAEVRLSDGVRITTSDGWALTAPAVTARTDRTGLASDGAVTGFAPFGRVDAGALSVSRKDDAPVLDLTGGVRLIYQP
ncbi:MAG: hypothetical protein P3W90_001105 [Paracoccus sp. (in: a-proteobacteria)]|nr:hypothetical protein [Paracoccus sp. (in: a-proteobacteria)]